MNIKILSVLLFLLIFRLCECQTKLYTNYALYRAVPMTVDHIKFLNNVDKKKYIDIIFWKRPQKLFEEVHFIVSPRDENVFVERARHFGMTTELLIDNVQGAFDAQTITKYLRLHIETYKWESYHTLKDIEQWLADIAIRYPKNVVLESIGKTPEGRNIYVLGITSPNNLGTVIIEGGIHGNEWLSTEFVNYFAHEILMAKETPGKSLHSLANQYSWYFIPVLNPDGYEYTQTMDRMWKKNRRQVDSTSFGVDLNRNFDYKFGKFDAGNDSKDDNYCGPMSVSEPEVRALTEFINKKSRRLRFYFSIHSYGEKIIIPFGDRINHVNNYGEMENYAKQAILKIYQIHRIKYTTGTYYDTLGIKTSGSSADWVKSFYNVKYVFTFLLRDNGTYGYALPADQILPTCTETVAAITEIMTAKPRRLKANVFKSQGSILNGLPKCIFVVFYVFLIVLQVCFE